MKLPYALLLVSGLVAAADPATGTIPVDPGEEPDRVPVLPEIEWTVAGNLQYDALGSSDLPDDRIKSGELRRASISAMADLRTALRFKVGIDLAERAPGRERGKPLRELSVEYRGGPVYVEFGRMVEPFGLLQGGSRSASFMERPAASALGPGYGIGVAANWRGERWAASGGFFKPAENDLFFGGRAEQGVTVRVTGVPLRGEDGLLHAGFALSERKPRDSVLQFTAIPESVLLLGLNASSQRLITDSFRLYGAELAGQWGPLLARGEWMRADLGSSLGFEDIFEPGFEGEFIRPRFEGGYAELSWVITGERRDYSLRRGMFSGIYPERPLWRDGGFAGFGALEVAVRTGGVDLRDSTGHGERLQVSAAALAWTPVEFVKLIVEQLDVDERGADGTRDGASATQGRVQLSYAFP